MFIPILIKSLRLLKGLEGNPLFFKSISSIKENRMKERSKLQTGRTNIIIMNEQWVYGIDN